MADAACTWQDDRDDGAGWATSCGRYFVLIDGTPSDNRMVYCCYCGKPLVEMSRGPEPPDV